MDINEARKHWFAYTYDQEVTETDDIDFLLEINGKQGDIDHGFETMQI